MVGTWDLDRVCAQAQADFSTTGLCVTMSTTDWDLAHIQDLTVDGSAAYSCSEFGGNGLVVQRPDGRFLQIMSDGNAGYTVGELITLYHGVTLS